MDYKKNLKYFTTSKNAMVKDIILIVIGVLCFALWWPLALILIAIGAVMLYMHLNVLSDQQYDQVVQDQLSNLKTRALDRLGIDEDEVKEIEPITIGGYVYTGDDRHIKELLYKKGKDDYVRTNEYNTVIIFFSANEVHCYQKSFFTTKDKHSESTDVYFYSDIVSVSTKTENTKITLSDGSEEDYEYQSFVLKTSGGSSLEVTVRNADENVNRSINAMRQLLREKKTK